jgi:hypothetical protein
MVAPVVLVVVIKMMMMMARLLRLKQAEASKAVLLGAVWAPAS